MYQDSEDDNSRNAEYTVHLLQPQVCKPKQNGSKRANYQTSPCLQFYPKALCRHLAKRSKSPMNEGFGKALQMLWMSLHALLERTRGSMLSECPCLQVQVDLPFRSSFEFKELPDEKNRPNVNFNLRRLPGLSQRPHGQPPRNQRLHPRRP